MKHLPNQMTYNLTQGDIDSGVPWSPTRCAHALCLTRELKARGIPASHVFIGRNTIRVSDDSEEERVIMTSPAVVANTAERLDDGEQLLASDIPQVTVHFSRGDRQPLRKTMPKPSTKKKRVRRNPQQVSDATKRNRLN